MKRSRRIIALTGAALLTVVACGGDGVAPGGGGANAIDGGVADGRALDDDGGGGTAGGAGADAGSPGAAGATPLPACPGAPPLPEGSTACREDTDCPAGAWCGDGTDGAVGGAGGTSTCLGYAAECYADAECPAGEACAEFHETDSTCTVFMTCRPCLSDCILDVDCPAGEICAPVSEPYSPPVQFPTAEGACNRVTCQAGCTTGSCAAGEACDPNGHCYASPCTEGFACDEGHLCDPSRTDQDAHGCAIARCDFGEFTCPADSHCEDTVPRYCREFCSPDWRDAHGCAPDSCTEGYTCPENHDCATNSDPIFAWTWTVGPHGCYRRSCTSDEQCDCGACISGRCQDQLFVCSEPVIPPPPCVWEGTSDGVLDDAVEISASADHTCARRVTGEVACWGLSDSAQLGDGAECHSTCTGIDSQASFDCARLPVGVADLADAVAISAGGVSTCALRASGEVVCWGGNHVGSVGDGTTTRRPTPVAVTGLVDVVQISLGALHGCALRATGEVACWGYGSLGQLGDGEPSHLACGGDECSLSPVTVAGLTDAVEISSGNGHVCARRGTGEVVCWGRSGWGQLGDGVTAHASCVGLDCSRVPVSVSGLIDAVEISSGGIHSCARRASGEVVCWGSNQFGQLGDGTMTHSNCGGFDCAPAPVAVPGMADVEELSTGHAHTCARRASGEVVCWGSNSAGQLGDGTMTHSDCEGFDCSPAPVPVSTTTDVVQLSTGTEHTCVLRTSGEVACWGRNDLGQLGDGVASHSQCRLDFGMADCSFSVVSVLGVAD